MPDEDEYGGAGPNGLPGTEEGIQQDNQERLYSSEDSPLMPGAEVLAAEWAPLPTVDKPVTK